MSEEQSKDMARVQEHVNKLIEFYDSVHVFCTRHEPQTEGGTITVNLGAGNWHARYGQITEWTIKQDEYARISARTPDENKR